MKIGELKKSLAKFPPDMDDMEAYLSLSRSGEKQYEALCFTGYVPIEGSDFAVLGGLSMIQHMVEAGEMGAPAGYIAPSAEQRPFFTENSPRL